MGRDNSPHIVGPYWLDLRPDNKSPYWQIATYDDKARTVRYRSTRCREIAAARDALDAFYHDQRSAKPQDASALVVPQLVRYWREHGRNAVSPDQIATSLRQFIAFLFQDPAGADVTFAELRPDVFARFQSWRMRPHSYAITWEGRDYRNTSRGVNGETVQRNLDDIRAALNFAAANGRVPFAPKVKGVRSDLRSPPRDRVLSVDELGAMIGYALSDPPLLGFLVDILATAARPEAVMKWQHAKQARPSLRLFDAHPPGAPRTKKRNPTVPIPLFWNDWLAGHVAGRFPRSGTMRTRWRTMRRALSLGPDVTAKTIRHTMATYMRSHGVPMDEISGQLGHAAENRTTEGYAKYAPDYLCMAREAIDALWLAVMFSACSWSADHSRTKIGRGRTIVLANASEIDCNSANSRGGR